MHLLALRTVLVATDLDSGSVAAIESGRSLAAAAGATFHLVHVGRETPTPATGAAVEAFVRQAGVELHGLQMHLLNGDPAHLIRLLADRINADVIVLWPHRERDGEGAGPGLGSTALAIVTDSFTPCLVTRTPIRVPLGRVLVGVDRSDTARGALVVGLSWASGLRARNAAKARPTSMLALHVDRTAAPGAPASAGGVAALEQEVQRIRGDAGDWAEVSIEQLTISAGDPAGAIAGTAAERHADLIVVGTRGLGFDRTGRLGSVSARLVRNCSTPVLLVPPAVWMSHAASEAKQTAG